jgi:hypothetical protein
MMWHPELFESLSTAMYEPKHHTMEKNISQGMKKKSQQNALHARSLSLFSAETRFKVINVCLYS